MTTAIVIDPLNQPEILDLVAKWLPVWRNNKPYYNDVEDYLEFQPKVFLSCLRVSKLWYRCFLPHLWHFHYEYSMSPHRSNKMDPAVFEKHFPLIRRHWYTSYRRDEMLPFSLYEDIEDRLDGGQQEPERQHQLRLPMPTNLLGLSIESRPTVTMERLLVVNAVNLRELHWKGEVRVKMASLPDEVLLSMKQMRSLQVLWLCNWDISTKDMSEILASCQETLQYLTIQSVSGFKFKRPDVLYLSEDQDHSHSSGASSSMTDSDSDSSLDSDPELEAESSPIFVLHRLTELELHLDWTQSDSSVYLPQFCPGLETIKLVVDRYKDFRGMIKTVRAFCPRLKAVNYREGYSMAHEYGYFPPLEIYKSLIEDCTRPLSSFREKDSRGRKDLAQAMATTTITSGATDMDKSTRSNSSATIESSRRPPTSEARTTLSGLCIGLQDGLTEAITTSILVNAATLETIQLRFRDRGDGPESMRWIQRILQTCPSLKSAQFDEVHCVFEDLDILLLPPLLPKPSSPTLSSSDPFSDCLGGHSSTADWVCRGLRFLSLEGRRLTTENNQDKESLARWKILQTTIQPWVVQGPTENDPGRLFQFVQGQCPNLRWMRLNKREFSRWLWDSPWYCDRYEEDEIEEDEEDDS
ncbi:hypothetical protein BGZ83_008659 [Gryganskiella cystojenkinii]|nr:hypothetical protein BGZ83_008659 [Gryganskiella cystojenkinii]